MHGQKECSNNDVQHWCVGMSGHLTERKAPLTDTTTPPLTPLQGAFEDCQVYIDMCSAKAGVDLRQKLDAWTAGPAAPRPPTSSDPPAMTEQQAQVRRTGGRVRVQWQVLPAVWVQCPVTCICQMTATAFLDVAHVRRDCCAAHVYSCLSRCIGIGNVATNMSHLPRVANGPDNRTTGACCGRSRAECSCNGRPDTSSQSL
jgi:hypothetical protein